MALGRRRRRSLRRIDPISVLKTSLLLYTGLAVTVGTALIILWTVARGSGLITRLENGIKNSGGLASFEIDSLFVFKILFALLVFWIFVGSAINVLAVVLYNLTADVVGGIQITVLEELPQSPKVEAETGLSRGAQEVPVGARTVPNAASPARSGTLAAKVPPKNTATSASKHNKA